jgi:aryl-alcohol dehydrogenase-like predicted oxidoreductase
MEHRKLGATGLSVSPLCLGAMMFGAWGNRDHDDSIAIIHAALDAAINFIDTADVYSCGESEEIVDDMSIRGNQAKLEAAQALGDVAEQAGMPLIEMSLRFVASHPAVTAAIIGPRTMEQLESQLSVLERPTLPGEVLDRIDEIVAPGTNVNQADTGWDPPWLTDPSQRRR